MGRRPRPGGGAAPEGPVLLALSGSETVEQAEALSKLVREGLGSDAVVLPEQASPALDAFRAPLSSIGKAERVIVIGDDPVEARAPVVGLWIKAARRNGAEIVSVGASGTHPTAPGGAAETVRGARRQGQGRCADLVGPGRSRRRDRRGAGAGARRGLGLLSPRHAERPRGRRGLGRRGEPERPEKIGTLLISRRRCRRRPACPGARSRRRRRRRDRDVRRPAARVGRPRPAGDELPRARRDDGQSRGAARNACAER